MFSLATPFLGGGGQDRRKRQLLGPSSNWWSQFLCPDLSSLPTLPVKTKMRQDRPFVADGIIVLEGQHLEDPVLGKDGMAMRSQCYMCVCARASHSSLPHYTWDAAEGQRE